MDAPQEDTDRMEDAQREVDERIDELTREGEEMQDRLDSAEGEAEEVPDPEESTEGGLGVSDLTRDSGDADED